MDNVAFDSASAAASMLNMANQRSSGAIPQGESGMFGWLSVKNWPDGFKDTVRWGGETLARKLAGTSIEKRAVGHAAGHDQEIYGTKESENCTAKSSLQESVESQCVSIPSDPGVNSKAMTLLALMTKFGLVSSQGSTTVIPDTTTAQVLKEVISFDRAVFAQSVKECTELVAFLNVAINDALTDIQKTATNKTIIIGTSAAAFLSLWVGVGAGFGHLLANQLASGDKTDLLIKSIEGATKLWAAYKLHQLNLMSKELEGEEGNREAVDVDPDVDLEASRLTALERKYKARLNSDIYGDLRKVVAYVVTQAAREGGELGVLSGVTMAPYLIAGADLSAAVATIALSGGAGIALPVAAYFGTKGALGLGKQIEKCFNDTGWLTSKIEAFLGAAGNWTKEMLVFALASYAVHEFEELWGFDVKLWNLTEYSPWLSEKNMPFAAVAAVLPYDADPTFWQAMVIAYAWSTKAVLPCTKQAAKLISELYHKCKGDSLSVTGATSSTDEPNASRVSALPSGSTMREVGEASSSHQRQYQDNLAFEPDAHAHQPESTTYF